MSERRFEDYDIDVSQARGVAPELDTFCPKCTPSRKPANQRKRDLSFNTDKGVWNCAHCSWSGSLKQGVWQDSILPTKREYVRPEPLPPVDPAAERWRAFAGWAAEKRGVSEPVLLANGVYPADVWFPRLGEDGATAKAVCFPYVRSGVVVNVKSRTAAGPKDFRLVTGAERCLYKIDALAADASGHTPAEWAITEGEWDALAVEEVGLPAVSVPDGASLPGQKQKLECLDDPIVARAIASASRILVAVDADEPGDALADEVARRCGPEKCYRVRFPDGCKDASDVLVKHGRETLTACLWEATPWPVHGIIEVNALMDKALRLWDTGPDRGVGVGVPSLDRHIRWMTGALTIVGAYASSGKTAWIDWLTVQLAKRHGWGFVVCSPEFLPEERHLINMVSVYLGQRYWDGPTPRISKADAADAMRWIDNHFAFVQPEDATVASIIAAAEAYVVRRGIRGVVVDPWNEIDHAYEQGDTEAKMMNRELSQIARYAKRRGLHVFVCAHPKNPTILRDKDTGAAKIPVPTVYDYAGGAAWANKADGFVTIERDKQDTTGLIRVHIQKLRFAEAGELGTVDMHYDRVTGRYSDTFGAAGGTR